MTTSAEINENLLETAASREPGGSTILQPSDTFVRRHIGPNADEVKDMLKELGLDSLDELVEQTVPPSIRLKRPLKIGEPRGEHELLLDLKKIASKNKVLRSFI